MARACGAIISAVTRITSRRAPRGRQRRSSTRTHLYTLLTTTVAECWRCAAIVRLSPLCRVLGRVRLLAHSQAEPTAQSAMLMRHNSALLSMPRARRLAADGRRGPPANVTRALHRLSHSEYLGSIVPLRSARAPARSYICNLHNTFLLSLCTVCYNFLISFKNM